MKTQLSIPIVILASNFMLSLLVFGQEKAATPAPNPFQPLLANPSLVQQVEAISLKFDEAFNKHDGDAVMALFTTTATQVTPVGTFIGREAIEKYYGNLFQNLQPQGRATKINYVYTYGADLCALGGWIVTIQQGSPNRPGSQQVGGFLINIYTQVRGTWKTRTSVFNYATGP
jgi:ketosteroid isomerase-like protein